jgi:hypothetical protein
MNNKSNFIKYIITACFVLLSVGINATEIWVSPKGDNKNPGTELKPLATLDMAIRKARELRRLSDPAVKNGIHIFLKGGIYELQDPVFIQLLFRMRRMKSLF